MFCPDDDEMVYASDDEIDLEKEIPNEEARAEIWIRLTSAELLLNYASDIIREFDGICESKTIATQLWEYVVFCVSKERVSTREEFLHTIFISKTPDKQNPAVYAVYKRTMDRLLGELVRMY